MNTGWPLKLVQRLRSAPKSSCPEPSTGVLGEGYSALFGASDAEACVKRLELLGNEFPASMTREEDLFGVRGPFAQLQRHVDVDSWLLSENRDRARCGPRLGVGPVALEEFLAQESELRCRLAAGRAQRWWKLGRRRSLPPQKACCVRSDAIVEFLLGCMCAVASW